MKIWLRNYPLLCDPTSTATWLACCTNDADGTVNYGDDNFGAVVSIEPPGNVSTRPNGTKGIWEQQTADSSVNVLIYKGTGIPYRVPYRAR